MLQKSFWLQLCRQIGNRDGARGRRVAKARSVCPAEILEERTMLSTITVTTLTDSVATDGQVSLREAINAANSNSSVDGSTAGESGGVQDLIVFQQGLTGTILLDSSLGQLGIGETVRINGLGSSSTIIDAQSNSRVFYIDSAAGDVALDNLTVTNGATFISSDHGGGITFHSSGTLSLTGSVVTNNSTAGFDAAGGGIFSDSGNVSLTNSTVSQNSAAGIDAEGAGIAAVSGNVTLTNSIVSGNSTLALNSEGAGIYAGSGDVTLVSSTVTGNSTLAGNSDGGGIYVLTGDVTVTDSTISNNSTLDFSGTGGGIHSDHGDVTVLRSTISGNSTAGANSVGGGISSITGDISITNSTIANNSATGGTADGGGVWGYSGLISIESSTISGNSALGLGADGGGVYAYTGSLTVTNSIVAGNSAHILSSGQDIFFYDYLGTATITATYSLIGKNGGSTLSPGNPDGNGNLIGTDISPIDPMLRALANNGGPTQTMALIKGSPAINAGGTTSLTTDQRGTGFFRVVDAGLDMGAYEYQLYDTTPVKTYDVVEGGTFANVVIMTFTSPDPSAVANDFTIASIDWGATVLNQVVTIEFVSATSTQSNFRVVATATYPSGSATNSPYAVEVTVEDTDGLTVSTDNTTFAVAPPTNPPRHLDRQTGIAGFYYANGLLAKVMQNGSVLTLVDETGATSRGTVTNGVLIDAPDFGLTGEFDPSFGTITFSDSTVWTKVRQIEGKWLTGTGKVAGIKQLGTELTFTGGTGSSSAGAFTSATSLSLSQWAGVTGTLSIDGTQIDWSNGTVWYLIPDFQGDWDSSTGGPTRIEQNGTTLLFVNRSGQTSTGSMISSTQVVTGANWGSLVGTIDDDSIQFSNGTTWVIPSTTTGYPDLGGLWQRSTNNQDVRVLQADLVLTFVNASGSVSAGQFLSETVVFATDWNQQGTIVGSQIQWANGTNWNQLPYVSGIYINQNNAETGITQLEHQLTITDQYGNVTHGTLVDATNIVETDGDHRTATINSGVITWSNSPVWTNLPGLSGNWQENAGYLPTYVEQSGLKLLFLDQTGVIFTGGFLTPTTAQVTEQIIPAPPPVNVTIPDAQTIDFGVGLEWTKFPATVLDDVFADPNFWPFL